MVTTHTGRADVDRIAAWLLGAMYGHAAAGGYLHIVTDDYNADDEAIWWCHQQAAKGGPDVCEGGRHLALLLAPLLRSVAVDEDSRWVWLDDAGQSVEYRDGRVAGEFAHADACP